MAPRFWVGVASKDHIQRGIAGGFCQLCHGKAYPLRRMAVGDWLIYYSPKEVFAGKTPCQKFTAIGKVTGADVYQVEMAPGFIPFRRDISFLEASDVAIHPLIGNLSFIQDKERWGYAFRFGHLEATRSDFEIIASRMLGYIPDPLTGHDL